jgi:hypothetical protein
MTEPTEREKYIAEFWKDAPPLTEAAKRAIRALAPVEHTYRDTDGRCTICGSTACRYPASQSCFAAALDNLED